MVKRAMHLGHLYSAQWLPGSALPAGQRLEVVDQPLCRRSGVPDDARAARGALLKNVQYSSPSVHRVCCHTKTKTSTRPALRSLKASMSSKFTGRWGGEEPEQLVAFDRCHQVSPSTPRQCARTHHMKQSSF